MFVGNIFVKLKYMHVCVIFCFLYDHDDFYEYCYY